ncbi:TPA: 2Fe-2S iron-sulfur cluster binding domain-containing protein [Candidatus Poribacteria bacterium]|nr:2Fe-2S iron-sulfur cluster binding domain-containing protein [Candidatus Poribacteria bacterium]HIA69727.1 2Fe-2S iron-sulfur cluster binding domain-containing protein [Candidatus Poribacteria bacterium]HIB89685.1 2Fe-2S iron-sulfur cluster binding domain-containing protein [Candidatus Poribacteria bacterium]HIC00230.1 2Fe-2S iron-sulfur cluster binding domain-containing protein [Candidatus Poribacteria bacterium]HIN32076.1 2Fe-2S iron-sulfur cluster binding domain-containing protein [Candid
MTLMEASRFAGISHALICSGNGRCPTCRTKILLGNEQQTLPMRRRSYKE